MQHGLKFGSLLGIISVAISLVLYLVNKELLVGSTVTLAIFFVLTTVFMVLAAKAAKADNMGVLPYGEAVITTFVTLSVGLLFSSIFTYVLYNFIDPSMVELTQEKAAEMAEKMMDIMGGDNEDAKDQMREQMESQDFSMSLGQVILSWITNSVMGLIYSLIIAAFVKKNPQL